jgi:hypothetical protein
MNSNLSNLRRCDGVTRRDMLRVGGLTAFGLGLGDLFRLQRTAASENTFASPPKAKSCVLIWLDGGPSHLETFDPKPEAPSEVRGPLGSIATKLPGVRISECLPRTAAMLDKLAIIRSMTSPLGEHNFGTHYMLTGYKPTPVLEYPTYGAVLAQVHQKPGVLPPYIAVPDFRVGGGRLSGGGYLPAPTRPFSIGADPAKADFQVRDLDFYQGLDLARLDRRRQFVHALDAFSQDVNRTSSPPTDPDLERAYNLISSAEAKSAFDLSAEPPGVRQRYGGKSIGQCCLLARRLIERREKGVRYLLCEAPGGPVPGKRYLTPFSRVPGKRYLTPFFHETKYFQVVCSSSSTQRGLASGELFSTAITYVEDRCRVRGSHRSRNAKRV